MIISFIKNALFFLALLTTILSCGSKTKKNVTHSDDSVPKKSTFGSCTSTSSTDGIACIDYLTNSDSNKLICMSQNNTWSDTACDRSKFVKGCKEEGTMEDPSGVKEPYSIITWMQTENHAICSGGEINTDGSPITPTPTTTPTPTPTLSPTPAPTLTEIFGSCTSTNPTDGTLCTEYFGENDLGEQICTMQNGNWSRSPCDRTKYAKGCKQDATVQTPNGTSVPLTSITWQQSGSPYSCSGVEMNTDGNPITSAPTPTAAPSSPETPVPATTPTSIPTATPSPTTPPPQSVDLGKLSPARDIPDNDANGIISTMEISSDFIISKVILTVDITHPNTEDLTVTLYAPNGSSYRVWNKEGASKTDIKKTFDEIPMPLDSTKGTWKLVVTDTLYKDKGKLNSWSLKAISVGCAKELGKLSPSLNIPDNNTTGITSTMEVAGDFALSHLILSVDISHTYIGDLTLKIEYPNGKSYVFWEKEGGSSDDLKRTFKIPVNLNSTKGTWKLVIVDSAGSDVGKLNSWTLKGVSTTCVN